LIGTPFFYLAFGTEGTLSYSKKAILRGILLQQLNRYKVLAGT
jgi:hypothetical protein